MIFFEFLENCIQFLYNFLNTNGNVKQKDLIYLINIFKFSNWKSWIFFQTENEIKTKLIHS